MMPVVRINDATFASLSTLKTWFGTKTPSETIDKIVRDAMEELDLERDEEPEGFSGATGDGTLEFKNTPGLAFTKPLSASINGKKIGHPRWSEILLAMIAQVRARGLEGEKLVNELQVRAKAGQYQEEGYKYHSELGISVQGQSASDAWREIDRIARKWGIPVTVDFWWRQNDKAQFPGRTGRLRSADA